MTCDDDIVLALYSDCAWHQLMREHASRSSDAPNTVQTQPKHNPSINPNTVQTQPKHNQNIIQLNTVQPQPKHNPSINPNTVQTQHKHCQIPKALNTPSKFRTTSIESSKTLQEDNLVLSDCYYGWEEDSEAVEASGQKIGSEARRGENNF